MGPKADASGTIDASMPLGIDTNTLLQGRQIRLEPTVSGTLPEVSLDAYRIVFACVPTFFGAFTYVYRGPCSDSPYSRSSRNMPKQ
jgi:hypothetical protein